MASQEDKAKAEEELGTGTGSSARPGGKAADGIAPRPGDPTTPQAAARRAAASNKRMREGGFGDHKGADIDGDGDAGER